MTVKKRKVVVELVESNEVLNLRIFGEMVAQNIKKSGGVINDKQL